MELIKLNTDAANLLFEDQKGIAATVRGDVLQIVRCQDVSDEVSIRTDPEGYCYASLPIYYRGESKFLNGGNNIIIDSSSIVDCESEGAVHFIMENFVTQGAELKPFPHKVQTLSAHVMNNKTLFPVKIPYQLGGLHGKVANF